MPKLMQQRKTFLSKLINKIREKYSFPWKALKIVNFEPLHAMCTYLHGVLYHKNDIFHFFFNMALYILYLSRGGTSQGKLLGGKLKDLGEKPPWSCHFLWLITVSKPVFYLFIFLHHCIFFHSFLPLSCSFHSVVFFFFPSFSGGGGRTYISPLPFPYKAAPEFTCIYPQLNLIQVLTIKICKIQKIS